MSDKELLELAAKAGGYDIDPLRYDDEWGFAIRGTATFWNPKKCNDDAFRLGIDAGLCIFIADGGMGVGRYHAAQQGLEGASEDVAGKRGEERHAVFRLAIVKAAAEIERKKQ